MCIICLQFTKMSFTEQVFALDEAAPAIGNDHAKEVMKLICNTEIEKMDAEEEGGVKRTAKEELADTLAIDMLSRMVYSVRTPEKAEVIGIDLALDYSDQTVYHSKELAADEVAKIYEEGPPAFDWDAALKSWDEPDDHPVSEADQAELDKVLESQLKMPC